MGYTLKMDAQGLLAASLVAAGCVIVAQAFAIQRLTHLQKQSESKYGETIARMEELREVERKGRITSQKRARQAITAEAEELGYRYVPIATVESPFPDRRGTPRQPLLVNAAKGRIRFNKRRVQYDYFKEIESFNYIWVLFVFHENTNIDGDAVSAKIRPPRLGVKVGCLTTRSPHRPNNIGLSVCRVERVCSDYIEISGLDMVDGTPVIDVKPYIPCDSIAIDPSVNLQGSYAECVRRNRLIVPNWIVEDDVPMRSVTIKQSARELIEQIIMDQELRFCDTAAEAEALIVQVLRQDIRGIAQGRKIHSGQEIQKYMCRLDCMEISFYTFDDEIVVDEISCCSVSR